MVTDETFLEEIVQVMECGLCREGKALTVFIFTALKKQAVPWNPHEKRKHNKMFPYSNKVQILFTRGGGGNKHSQLRRLNMR